ncbi:MAG: sel1 repeat family protein, partial [Cellvibrionales bacterium]|nr:sel1 repeat family protein [Cellvibrionales bacterium]
DLTELTDGTPAITADPSAMPPVVAMPAVDPLLTADQKTVIDLRLNAENGNAQAAYDLGIAYKDADHGLTTDNAEAYYWLTLAANAGHQDTNDPTALTELVGTPGIPAVTADPTAMPPVLAMPAVPAVPGLITAEVKTAQDKRIAALAANNAQDQFDLGILYRDGTGLTASNTRAYFWLTRAAQNGHIEPATSPALATVTALITDAARITALNTQATACRANHYTTATGPCGAPEDLAALHARATLQENGGTDSEGNMVTADPMAAAPLYQQAADRGHAPAQVALAQLYDQNRGVTGTTEERQAAAAALYRKAALQGNTAAQYALGRLYDTESLPAVTRTAPDGTQTEEDRAVTAARLYQLAANAGNTAAQLALARLYDQNRGVTGTPEERAAEARRLYGQAAASDDPDAQYFLGQLFEQNRGITITVIERLKADGTTQKTAQEVTDEIAALDP